MKYELYKSHQPGLAADCIKLLETGAWYFHLQGGQTYGIIEISLWLIRIFSNVSIDQHHDHRLKNKHFIKISFVASKSWPDRPLSSDQ